MSEAAGIDPRAVIADGAEIGRDVKIDPFCVIGPDVKIGDRCRIGAGTVIEGHTELGPDNLVSPKVVLGGPPQDVKYRGGPTRLVVGAGNQIREFVTFHRGTEGGRGVTRIGDGNLFMAYAHVGHDCVVGDRTVFVNAATLAGHVDVGADAQIGACSGVHQFCRIARHAFIGGYSVVTQDALPWVITVGNRATTRGPNLVGLRRAGYPRETIRAIKTCYATLIRSKLSQQEALEKIEAELGHVEEARYFVEFVRGSQRGICR